MDKCYRPPGLVIQLLALQNKDITMKSSQLLAAAILFVGISGIVYADENGVCSKNQICRTVSAKIMGRNPSIIKIDRVASDVIYLSYVR